MSIYGLLIGIGPYLLHECRPSSFGFSHQRIFFLQFLLSNVSSSVTSTSAMSSFTTSIHLLFGLPRFLFPGNSIISILLQIYPSSFLRRYPYHISLASRVYSPNFPTCAVPLMYSFLILSILVTPNENRNIFNSATSISACCLFVSATVSNPYNIAGLTATLYTFPFTLAGTLLSQITPDIILHPFHPACNLFFTSLPHSPLRCTVESRYLKSSTFATSSPCIFTVPLLLSCLSFTHMYSVFILLTFIPLLSKAYLQPSGFSSTCSLLSLQITMSSANIMVHGASSLISSVILSIIIANKQGLKADPWCSLTFTSNPSVTPTAHLTAVVLSSYISCTIITYFSANPDLHWSAFSTTADQCILCCRSSASLGGTLLAFYTIGFVQRVLCICTGVKRLQNHEYRIRRFQHHLWPWRGGRCGCLLRRGCNTVR